MKKRILSALAAVCLACSLATSCADSSSQSDSSTASSSSSAAESSSAADSSSSADSSKSDSSSEAVPKYDYVHGTDGYFNLTDELKHFRMEIQKEGTCWLYAGRASMATAFEKQTGKELNIQIFDMLESIYGADKQEGIILNNMVEKAEIGGYQWFVTDRLSRGFKDGITLDSSAIIDPTDREAIQNTIKTRGGVAVGIDEGNSQVGTFGDYQTMNYKQAQKYDHAVTLVGWDDHFPKEYFKEPAEQDGAWIVYNSNLGERLYYISYCAPLEYAVSHSVTDKYSEVISYDAGNMLGTYIKTGDTTKAANVFHKKGKLAAVGTFNDFDKQDIKIEIMSADFKTVLHTQDAVLGYNGYQTVELTKPVDVEDYAVVITYSKGAPVEGDGLDTIAGSYTTTVKKGESFVFVDGKWKDITDRDIRSAIRTEKGQMALFDDKGAWKDFLTDDIIQTMVKTEFAPGNCCIKALYVK